MILFRRAVFALYLSICVPTFTFAVTNNENDAEGDAADSSSSLFLEYAISGDLVRMQNLVEQNPADLNINARDLSGRTALMIAIIEGHLEIVKYLLSLDGIDVVDAVDNHRQTTEQIAIQAKKKNACLTTLLIEGFVLTKINGPFGGYSNCVDPSDPAYQGG